MSLQALCAPAVVAGAAALAVVACREPTGAAREPPYLAIVALNDAPAGSYVGDAYGYRVRELSGTVGLDTTIRVTPRDTVILPVPPATYSVALAEGLPPSCQARYGLEQVIVVPENTNTSLARYHLSCRALLTVEAYTEGYQPDSVFILALSGGTGTRTSPLLAGSPLRFDRAVFGTQRVTLSQVAGHCLVVSDGGPSQSVIVPDTGGAALLFRVACSDPARRPRFLSAAASYRDGVSAFVARVTDPDRDVERYTWDITDCQRASVLLHGGRTRRGLTAGRTAYRDTVTIVAAFEVGLPEAAMAGRCTAIRVADEYGYSTPVLELPIQRAGAPPAVTQFNARFASAAALDVQLAASDADGDLVGTFAAFRYRDGITSAPDGQPDYGVYHVAGYLGTAIPRLALPIGPIRYYDLLASVIYLIDNRGNVTRLEDSDLLR